MDHELRVVARFEINPGGRAEFERLAKEATAYANGHEEGTLTYDWYIAGDGKTAHIYERYESSEALLAHLAGDVGTKILPPIMQVAPMTSVDVYGRTSDQLKAVAENFPAVLFGERLIGLGR